MPRLAAKRRPGEGPHQLVRHLRRPPRVRRARECSCRRAPLPGAPSTCRGKLRRAHRGSCWPRSRRRRRCRRSARRARLRRRHRPCDSGRKVRIVVGWIDGVRPEIQHLMARLREIFRAISCFNSKPPWSEATAIRIVFPLWSVPGRDSMALADMEAVAVKSDARVSPSGNWFSEGPFLLAPFCFSPCSP